MEFIDCETKLIATIDTCVHISPMEPHCWLYFSSYNCVFHWVVVGQARPKDSIAHRINRETNLCPGIPLEYSLW